MIAPSSDSRRELVLKVVPSDPSTLKPPPDGAKPPPETAAAPSTAGKVEGATHPGFISGVETFGIVSGALFLLRGGNLSLPRATLFTGAVLGHCLRSFFSAPSSPHAAGTAPGGAKSGDLNTRDKVVIEDVAAFQLKLALMPLPAPVPHPLVQL